MNPITFTEAALTHIKTMIQKTDHAIGFRLSIKKTGCSGYAYVPEVITEKNDKDILFSNSEIKFYIDEKSMEILDGITIDYGSEAGDVLKQKKLIFINNKETGRCGCGESFTF